MGKGKQGRVTGQDSESAEIRPAFVRPEGYWPALGEPIRLNLGAGYAHKQGFVNCDLADNWSELPPDAILDCTAPLPIQSDSADEVHAYHFLEHIYRWQVEEVLEDWKRVLKPGGKLVLEMPCLDKIVDIFIRYITKDAAVNPQLTMWGIFGDPKYEVPEMVHKWCWSISEITQLLEIIGFKDIQIKTPETHIAVRDFRVEAIK